MLTDYIDRMARAGKRTAFVEQNVYRAHRYSYAQVVERAEAFKAWLEAQGLAGSTDGEAPRVILWAPASARWAMAFYGCILAGTVVVPIDAGFSPEFVKKIAAHTEARALLTTSAQLEKLGGCSAISIPCFLMDALDTLPNATRATPRIQPKRDTLLEIVYTSGTTSEPRGVMITHGNLMAMLDPVAKEIARYKRWTIPFRPLRFLDLVPLSHVFGQVMALFIPQFLDGEVIFAESQASAELARIVRLRRVSIMVCVPQQLEAMGDWAVAQVSAEADAAEKIFAERRSVTARFWKYRRLHQKLGWKMWAFVVGGAALPQRVERLWSAFGYAVVQGYGMTETASAIAITHPFKMRQGAVGRPIAGLETRIAADGEILVRGGNVSPGYYHNPEATRESFDGEWLRTGDLGRFDEGGHLIVIGRKKDVIVTADGLNVFPEDVERALAHESSIREAAVVGFEPCASEGAASIRTDRAIVHAVLVSAPGVERAALDRAIENANQRLEPHQRIHGYSVWPTQSLPRTTSTGKLRRASIAAWLNGESAGEPPEGAARDDWKSFLVRLGVPLERIRPQARLAEDLGLSSLDRVELMAWFETHGVPLDEETFARASTVAAIEELAAAGDSQHAVKNAAGNELNSPSTPLTQLSRLEQAVAGPPPHWPHTRWAGFLRAIIQWGLAFPVFRYYVRWTTEGVEKLRGLHEPALFVANHQSLMDAVLVLRALPGPIRRRMAPATGGDIYIFHPRRLLFLVRLCFNTFYLPLDPRGTRDALRHAGWLAEHGYSVLLFPEGERTPNGKLVRLKPGVGVLAERLGLPVIPLLIEGLYELWPVGQYLPNRGRVRLKVGETMTLGEQETAAQFTARLDAYYRNWMGS